MGCHLNGDSLFLFLDYRDILNKHELKKWWSKTNFKPESIFWNKGEVYK